MARLTSQDDGWKIPIGRIDMQMVARIGMHHVDDTSLRQHLREGEDIVLQSDVTATTSCSRIDLHSA
jgi:hypothetical protein